MNQNQIDGLIDWWRAEAKRLMAKSKELAAEGYDCHAEILKERALTLRQCARDLLKDPKK